MYTLGLGQSQKRGIGTHCREGERGMVQKGKEKTRRRGRGVEQKKHMDKIPIAVQRARRASPRRG